MKKVICIATVLILLTFGSGCAQVGKDIANDNAKFRSPPQSDMSEEEKSRQLEEIRKLHEKIREEIDGGGQLPEEEMQRRLEEAQKLVEELNKNKKK